MIDYEFVKWPNYQNVNCEQKLHKAVELARKRLEAKPVWCNTEYKWCQGNKTGGTAGQHTYYCLFSSGIRQYLELLIVIVRLLHNRCDMIENKGDNPDNLTAASKIPLILDVIKRYEWKNREGQCTFSTNANRLFLLWNIYIVQALRALYISSQLEPQYIQYLLMIKYNIMWFLLTLSVRNFYKKQI